MKKLWIVLLSVALIMAFTMPVFAVDVKFSGSYVAQGYYENNRALIKEQLPTYLGGPSSAFIWQRLRLQTEFQVQQGLALITRANIMEKVWGAPRSSTYTAANYAAENGNIGEDENIQFQQVYVTAMVGGGKLYVGYQGQSKFGTDFADNGDRDWGPRVRYDYVVGPWTFLALWDKLEGKKYYSSLGPAGNYLIAGSTSTTAVGNAYEVENDAEKYSVAFMYSWAKGNAGLLLQWLHDTTTSRGVTAAGDVAGYKRDWYIFDPYFKAQMGALYMEGEFVYSGGKTRKYDNTGIGTDQTKDGWLGYITGTYDFAPMYAGLTLVYVTGSDPGAPDKDNSGGSGGGVDFNPCLLLFNYDLGRWEGGLGGITNTPQNGGITNAGLAQVFLGAKPVPKLDVKASYTIAQADKDGASSGWQSKNYGSELDITATYKIYDNLSYMVGFAYLWTGDYFKGTRADAQMDNDYLITHKLTLSF